MLDGNRGLGLEVIVAGYQAVAQRNLTCAIRIRERRRQLGLTQAEVTRRVERHGSRLSSQALSAIENGRRLAVGRLPDLAAALDCTVTYLVGLTADPSRWEPDAPAEPSQPARRGTESGTEPITEPSAESSAEPARSGSPPGPDADRAPARPPRSPRPARPAPGRLAPVTPPRSNWILGPDVPDIPAELRGRVHGTAAAIPSPTPGRPR